MPDKIFASVHKQKSRLLRFNESFLVKYIIEFPSNFPVKEKKIFFFNYLLLVLKIEIKLFSYLIFSWNFRRKKYVLFLWDLFSTNYADICVKICVKIFFDIKNLQLVNDNKDKKSLTLINY